jgi:hypothetical protein
MRQVETPPERYWPVSPVPRVQGMPEATPKHLTRERGSSVLSHDPVLVVESAIAVLAIVLAMTMVLTAVPDGQRAGKPPGGGAVGVGSAADVTGSPPAAGQPTRTSGAAPAVTLGARPGAMTAFGNPVRNWSFEQDVNGWQIVGTGAGDGAAVPQGRTSGSCASVRARRPGLVGLAQTAVVPGAEAGSRYVAKAWVRSAAAGLKVTLRLVGTGAKPERSQATTTTLPGLAWRSVIVDHTVTGRTDLGVEITAGGVPAGEALLVDEVTVRQG